MTDDTEPTDDLDEEDNEEEDTLTEYRERQRQHREWLKNASTVAGQELG